MALEDMMAGLFGSNDAAGLDEMRRRRTAPGAGGGYEGIGGAAVLPGMMQARYGGLDRYDFSGGNLEQMGGQRGLMGLLGGRDLKGPALRHFQNQGFQPPGQQDNREKPGGPNIAPGNIDNAQSLYQPNANLTPGVPQGVAAGYEDAPGQMRPSPHTQGWRNLAEGYSAAAQFGSGGPNDMLHGGGPRQGAPAAAGAPPGATGGGGGHPGGGGGGQGGPAQSQNPVGGGGKAVAPAGPTGGGGGGTSGGAASGGKQTGGGGGAGPAAQTPGLSTRPGSAGAGLPGNATEANQANALKAGVKTARRQARANAYENASGGSASGMFGDTISPGGAAGQGGKGVSGAARGAAHEELKAANDGKLAGLTPAEKAARKSAWEAKVAAKQEKQRLQQASSASSFGANSATNDRGSGLAPLPKAGKTKAKATNVGQYGGKRR